MSDPRAEFLLARIADDEEQAGDSDHTPLRYGVDRTTGLSLADRLLAECETKRQIVQAWTRWLDLAANSREQARYFLPALNQAHQYDGYADLLQRAAIEPMLAVYVSHPDFVARWVPEFYRVKRVNLSGEST